MTGRTSRYLVLLALAAIAVVAVLFISLRKKKPEETILRADSPSVYMKDSEFRSALDEKRAERRDLLDSREKLLRELERRVDAMRAKMPGADDAAVRAELEKDADWNSLIRRIEDANTAFEENRQTTTKIVGARVAARPQKPLK